MTLLHRICILISISFFSSAVVAGKEDAARLNDTLQPIKSYRADFTQKTIDGRGKTTQTSYGRMALERPGKFRWDIAKPMPQLIVANKNTLWIYDPDLEQVTIRGLNLAAGEAPALLLSQDHAALEERYTVSQMPSKDKNTLWFSLVPIKPDNMFERITIGFANQQLTKMELKDHLGNQTTIQFKNIKTNQPLAGSLFTFTPPKNTDVIDERKH